jgi:NADH-quinone oxidoreductase subunit K
MTINFRDVTILNLILFVVGLLGVILNRKNILVTLMSIELLLLSISLNFLSGSIYFSTLTGEFFVLFIIAVAAAESSVALSLLTALCKKKSSLKYRLIKDFSCIQERNLKF